MGKEKDVLEPFREKKDGRQLGIATDSKPTLMPVL